MDGHLLKWIGFVAGWQQKYFAIEEDNFCCYCSKEDYDGRNKHRSINLANCEVSLDPDTRTQFQVKSRQKKSNEWFLKADSEKDRQSWIVALGSAKICLSDSSQLRKNLNSINRITLSTDIAE